MKFPSLSTALLLLVTTTTTFAGAPYTYWVMGSGNLTRRTGWDGGKHDEIRFTAKVGLRKITFSEKHNKPVWIRAEGGVVSNQGGDGEGDRKELSDEIGPMGGADLSVPSGTWIRGVQVCSQREKDDEDRQIRGLRFVTSKATSDGRIVEDSKTYEHKAAGCKDWSSTWARCDKGEIARGVRAFHNGKWYTGLELVCGPLAKH